MADAATPAPARKPKPWALVYKDYCTGCEACIQMCPIKDCIIKEGDSPEKSWVHVVPNKCIGCTLCVQICPWDCIEMLPRDVYPSETPGTYTGTPGDILKPSSAA